MSKLWKKSEKIWVISNILVLACLLLETIIAYVNTGMALEEEKEKSKGKFRNELSR